MLSKDPYIRYMPTVVCIFIIFIIKIKIKIALMLSKDPYIRYMPTVVCIYFVIIIIFIIIIDYRLKIAALMLSKDPYIRYMPTVVCISSLFLLLYRLKNSCFDVVEGPLYSLYADSGLYIFCYYYYYIDLKIAALMLSKDPYIRYMPTVVCI